jgi:hypothetical protein
MPGTDITEPSNVPASQMIKDAYAYPADWMYKWGPLIWFGVIPIGLGLLIYFILIRRQKKKENRISMERIATIE